MAEYIEREALLKKMLGLHTIPVYIGHVTDEDKMFETMVEVVEEQPTADVVEVVRCKDCIHREILADSISKEISAICLLGEALHFVEDNHYCSYGERRCE